MVNILIGVFYIAMSSYILFFSSTDKPNVLGYKSLQINIHKNIWLWTNKCFGIFSLIGSILYLLISVILLLTENSEYLAVINKYGLYYILISFVITEIYAFWKKVKDNQENT